MANRIKVLHLAGVVSRAVVVGVLAVELLVPGGWGGAAPLVLGLGLLVGLPHGAVDHLVPRLSLGTRAPRPAVVAGAYAVMVVAIYLAFRAFPGPALLLFVLISAVHFGTGETAFADLRAARPRRPDPLGAAAFGGTVIVLPLLHHRAEVAPLVAAAGGETDGLLPEPAATTAAATVLLLVAIVLVDRWRRHRRAEAAELALLLALVLLVPPLAAFGAYFGAWHSLRHLARLVLLDQVNADDLAAGRLARPAGRLGRQAALPTLAALAGLVGLTYTRPDWPGTLAVALGVVAALTVPHVLVVGWLDRQDRRTSSRTDEATAAVG